MTLIKSRTTPGVTPVLIMTIKGLLFSVLVTCGHTLGKELLPPRFVVEPQSVIARSGSSIVLYCTVEPEATTVRWMVNGSYLTSQKRRGFDMRDGSNLRIMSFNQPDSLLHEGLYQCVASNLLGTIVSREARVEAAVLGSYPASRTVTDITTIEGNVAVIPCSLPESKPRAVVEFLCNGSKLSPSGRLVTLPSGNLQIAKVSQNDQGLYQCSAVNLVTGNSVTSPAAFRLRVIVPKLESAPVFTSTPNDSITVNQGNNLTLECAAEGWPVPHITWEKYGGHLPVGRFSQLLGNLVISRIQKFDAGTYLCRVNKSSGGALEKVINVDVFEPPSIETAPTDQTATEGSTVVFKCRPQGSPKQGSPKPSIQWLFNGELIINEQFVSIRDTTLTLSNIHRRRAGMYQCIVRNGLGMVHASARLTVIDPQANAKTPPIALPTAPGKQSFDSAGYDEYEEEEEEEEEVDDYEEYDTGRTQPSETTKRRPEDEKTRNWNSDHDGELLAPTKPKVTILTNTSVLLNWKMHLGGAGEPAVSKFKIQVKEIVEETSSRWQMLDDDVSYGLRMFEVGSLRPGRTYRFRIVVVYSNGDSKPGPVSARVILSTGTSQRAQMPSPVVVEARPLSNSEIIIGWQQLDVDQWPVEGFYIHFAPFGSNGNFQRVIVPGSSVRHHVLSHLAPATSYTIRMQSYGKSGRISGFSNTVVKNTPTYNDELLPGDHVPKFPPGRYASTPRVRDGPASGRPDGWEQGLGDNGDGGSERQQLTYIILGIVLGIIVIVVVSCASVCVWRRQKNQRYGNNEQKNADQATAFLGNKRPSKPDGLVNISDYTYKVDNGHLPNCSGDCTLSAGPHAGNGFCSGKDSRACPPRPSCQPRKLAPDLVLPPPPAMPPPCHPYHNANPEISIYDTVDDEHQRSSPAYAKVSSLEGDSTGLYTTFPSPPAFGNLVRPSSDNIPKPLDSHAYWVLEQSRNQSLPDRPTTHVEPFAAPQPLPYRQSISSSSQPSNKSLTKSPFDRECVIQNSTDEENDRYEKPNSPRSTLLSGLPPTSAFNECDRMNLPDAVSWPPSSASGVNKQFQPDPVLGGRRPLPKPGDASTSGSSTRDPAGHDSWRNLTSQVSDGQYTIQSGPAKTGALSTAFALPRVNDYPSSDQEDCR